MQIDNGVADFITLQCSNIQSGTVMFRGMQQVWVCITTTTDMDITVRANACTVLSGATYRNGENTNGQGLTS